MKDFKNKVVVITGAGSGIGRALACAFASQGTKLALNDFNAAALRETIDRLQNTTDVFESVFDVSDRDKMQAFADAVIHRFGQVDIMVNNAGIGLGDYPFGEIDLNHFEKVMDVNFYGVLYGSRAFVPHLLKRPEAALINVSSVFGLTGIALSSAYCASKFAVHGLNQSLLQEYVNTPLTVHSVHPGGINTNIAKNSIDYNETHDAFHKQFLKLSPDYAAQVIIRGIKKKKKKILIGSEARQLDFVTRLFPIWGGRIVNRIIQHQVEAVRKTLK